MIRNPFASRTFTDIWLDCFEKKGSNIGFPGIDGIEFYKNLGVHVNVGKTHTKGIYYALNDAVSLKGRTCMIYDVPSYFQCPEKLPSKGVALKKIRQYPGFLIEVDQFEGLEQFMQSKFKKSSRYKLKKYRKRLSESFNISSAMFWGEMSKVDFENIFEKFRSLLQKRFVGKGEHNNNLDEQEWDFYKKVAYPMILKKEAGLFVVFNDEEPIAITLNYFSNDVIFDAITVFDTDYAKFHLGSVNIMSLIEWAIDNGFKILDFSKGYFDYKTRWATKHYYFEYHILYDSKSPISWLRAKILGIFLRMKQFLREKNLNIFLNKLRYKLYPKNNKQTGKIANTARKLIFEDVSEEHETSMTKINPHSQENKKLLFEFLYLFGENIKDVDMFLLGESDRILIKGKKTEKIAAFT